MKNFREKICHPLNGTYGKRELWKDRYFQGLIIRHQTYSRYKDKEVSEKKSEIMPMGSHASNIIMQTGLERELGSRESAGTTRRRIKSRET